MKLKDIIKTRKQIEEMGYKIENNYIDHVDINVAAHFGNLTRFEITCKNVRPMSGYNNIGNLGYIIRAFIELLNLSEENGLHLAEIENVPCRLVYDDTWGRNKCIGFGHFMEDKFVLVDEFAKIDE